MTNGKSQQGRSSRWRYAVVIVVAAAFFETAALWARSGRLGGTVIVRCLRGHLFATIWIPGASLKAVRLGWWRAQYCPIGRHWTVVTPVKDADLPVEDRIAAYEHQDIRIP